MPLMQFLTSFFLNRACLFIVSISKLSNSLNLLFIEQCLLLITVESSRLFLRTFKKFSATNLLVFLI